MGCGELGSYLCADCVNKMAVVKEPICPMCKRPAILGKTHARCLRPLGMDGLVAVFEYRGIIKQMVGKLKYRFVEDIYDTLVELVESMGDLSIIGGKNVVMVSVPLSKKRERWRGFNQADKLATTLSKRLGMKMHKNVLLKKRHTKSQMELSLKDRITNVRGAFGNGAEIESIKDRNVVLVDDVWTTGSTMKECTKLLKKNGAKTVWGLVLAR